MAIALGGNQINKAYLGTTEIQKMYLGSDLVFDNSIQPSELTPIMTNFRVNEATPTHVHFDSPLGPIEGLTIQGFTIAGKTVTAVDTLLGYFTVAESFDFWDQAATIRLENGNGVVYDFTMESIYNEMDEPTATTIRYMSADASGSGDGESAVNAWTASQAESATEGMTVWMKAGDYGAVTSWGPNNDGASDNPIKFIGYKDTIGDITENYLDSYDSGGKGISTDWDINAFPTFKGSSTIGASTATAISFSSSYIIIRNLQTENYEDTMTGGPDHFMMDNFNSRNNYHSTEVSYHGIFLQNNTTLNNMTFRNLVLLNHSQNTFAIQGNTADFNLYDNIRSWNDRTSDTERVDYHITFNGNNNIVRNCYVENFNDDNNGSSHGIGMKTTSTAHANNYNLIELSTAINQQECFYLRNYYCDYNVIKDCIADNNGSTSFNDCGGLWFWGGVHYNIYERCTVKNMNFCAIGLTDNAESPSWDEVGTDNIVRNCIFSNCKMGIYNKTTAASSAFNDNYFYNNIFHNITQQFMYTEPGQGVDITNLQMTNNVIDGCSSQGDALTGFVWDSNNFWQSWSNGLGANSMNIDPQWIDTDDFVPQNESMIAGRVANLHYDINKTERAETDSTLGAVLLESETGGGTPPVTDIDYYVSSTGTGDGLTENNPMSYADAKTQLSSMSAGEVMAFKRGDVFTSELVIGDLNGTSGNEIVLTAYGTGDLPKIDTVAEFDLIWTPQGGDVWTTPDPGFGRRIKINGAEVLVSPIHSELGTDIGDVVMFTYDSGSLYYSGATDPNTLIIEAPTVSIAIRVNIGRHFIIENIEIIGSSNQGVLLYGTDDVIVRNMTVGEMCRGGIALAYDAGNGGRNSNTSFINNTVDTKYTLDYSGTLQNSTTSEQFGGEDGIRYYDCVGGEVSGNYIKNWGHAGISMTATTSTSNVIENFKIFKNTLTSPDIAYGGRFVAEFEFRNSEIYNNNFLELKNHSHVHGHDNHYHHNIFKDITESPIKTYRQYGVDMNAQYADVYNNIVENNLFVNINDGAIDIEENGTLVYGNTFRNNIAFECGFDNSNRGMAIYGGSSNTFNDNIFYINGQISQVYYYTGNVDIETFNTQVSNSNSISGNEDSDPLFVGVSDYHLTESSPAVNAAATALATLDYEGNTIPYPGTLPDIGIYESDFTTGGTELVTNGTFDSDTDWTKQGGGSTSWQISGGVATRINATDWGLTQDIGAVAPKNYRISFEVTTYTSGILRSRTGDGGTGAEWTSFGLKTYDQIWDGTDSLIKFEGNFVGSIDNVSIKEIL